MNNGKKERDKMNNEYFHFAFMLHKSVKGKKEDYLQHQAHQWQRVNLHKVSRLDTLWYLSFTYFS